jgi:prepilin-type N-terminal cleavage/methylation domain-containing protein
MMKNTRSRGFTLIELLVVIAIIGILSAVVLASLNSARAKGADAAIKSDLANIRAQAELDYDNASPNSYGTFGYNTCPTTLQSGQAMWNDQVVINQIANAASASGATANAKCIGGGSFYVISVQLKSDTSKFWCVDSNGNSKQENSQIASGATNCT